MTTGPRDTHDDGRSSFEAGVRLADELHEQLASSRLAWEAALLRSDAALATGDAAEVQAALDDHRSLLGALEERLGAVVAGATAVRDVEDAVQGQPPVEPVEPTADRQRPPARRGASALVGAAAAVLLVTGVLASELPFEADGLLAGTEAPEGELARRTPPPSEPLGVAGPPRVGVTSRVDPPGTLPTASGGAATVPAPDDTRPGAGAPEVAGGRAPDRTVPSEDADPTDADGPVTGPVTSPERQRTQPPWVGELTESLPTRDGSHAQDLPAASPDPVPELPQDAVPPDAVPPDPVPPDPAPPSAAPAASEPTTELR